MKQNNRIVIANMMRYKNRQSYFAMHQILKKIHSLYENYEVVFYILWDGKLEISEDNINWEEKTDQLLNSYNVKLISFTKDFIKSYYKENYDISFDDLKVELAFVGFYIFILFHYIRSVCKEEYCLIYDDDIILNCDMKFILDNIIQQVPILIEEPMNANCDKCMLEPLNNLYDQQLLPVYLSRNPLYKGFNAGFQGIHLSIFDDFIDKNNFNELISLFDFTSIFDKSGKEYFGPRRFIIDTQQQSFFSTLNICNRITYPILLDSMEYFIIPNWGYHPRFGKLDPNDENEGWDEAMKSKIIHFIGHTRGKGKPKPFLNYVDKYLKEHNII